MKSVLHSVYLLMTFVHEAYSGRWFDRSSMWPSVPANEVTSVKAGNIPDCSSRVTDEDIGFAFNQSEKSCHLLHCVNPNVTDINVNMSNIDLFLKPPLIADYSLARGKPATMSSTRDVAEGYTFEAGKAVDGIYLPEVAQKWTSSIAISELSDNNPWWRVDLVQVYCVWGVNILNRAYIGAKYYQKNRDVDVTVSRDETQLMYDINPDSRCNYFDGPLNQYYTLIACIQPMRGQFIQIQYRNSSDSRINLYEIEIFGV